MEELGKELEKEREARKKASDEKAALEAEIESLSQALFEEVYIFSLSLYSCLILSNLPFTGEQNGIPRTNKEGRD